VFFVSDDDNPACFLLHPSRNPVDLLNHGACRIHDDVAQFLGALEDRCRQSVGANHKGLSAVFPQRLDFFYAGSLHHGDNVFIVDDIAKHPHILVF